jgi:hypothetical protein
MNHFLDVTIADLLARYPEAEHLLLWDELALFPSREAMSHGGILFTVRDAIKSKGVSEDLFLSILARELFCTKRLFIHSVKEADLYGSCNFLYENGMSHRLEAA